MKNNTAIIKALLSTMVKVNESKDFLIKNFYNEVLSELEITEFVSADNLLEYNKVYKNLIIATMKNYIYENSQENKDAILDIIDFLEAFKVVSK